MKTKRKFTAWLLAIAMIVSIMPMVALNVNAQDLIERMDIYYEPAYGEYIGLANYDFDPDDEDSKLVYYTLKYNKERADRAKWYPLYGNGIDVSKFIPRRDPQTYIIAFFEGLPPTGATAAVIDASATSITIKARQGQAGKTDIEYKDGKIVLDSSKTLANYDLKVNDGPWLNAGDIPGTLTSFATAENFPFGATVNVRLAATGSSIATLTGLANGIAASQRAVRVRIPAQGRAPRLAWTSTRASNTASASSILKVTDKVEWRVVNTNGFTTTDIEFVTGGSWTSLALGTIEDGWVRPAAKMDLSAANIKAAVTLDGVHQATSTSIAGLTVEVRTRATDRKPYSLVARPNAPGNAAGVVGGIPANVPTN